jgi:hypothetical protein
MATNRLDPVSIRARTSAGSWVSGNSTDIAFGTTAAGVGYKTVFGYPAISTLSGVKSLTFYIRRSDGYASRTVNVGAAQANGTASEQTLGSFSLSSNTSWQSKDFTAYITKLKAYTGTWYLWLWNNTDGQYADIYKTSYLVAETEDGAMYIGVNGVWVKCAVYQGVSGAWARVAPYVGVSGAWNQIGG